MTNTQYLESKIAESGLKTSFLVKNLGISQTAFYAKKTNKRKFRTAEIYVLCDLLNISEDERQDIFFA